MQPGIDREFPDCPYQPPMYRSAVAPQMPGALPCCIPLKIIKDNGAGFGRRKTPGSGKTQPFQFDSALTGTPLSFRLFRRRLIPKRAVIGQRFKYLRLDTLFPPMEIHKFSCHRNAPELK
jgi:hypothetical protein